MGSVWMILGNYDSSLIYINKALQIALVQKNYENITEAYILKAYVFDYKGLTDSTFKSILDALNMAKIAKNESLMAHVFNATGDFYSSYGDQTNALNNYQESYKLALKLKSTNLQLGSIIGIGGVYYLQNKIPLALSFYLKADSLINNLNEKTTKAQNLNNIALC